MKIICICVIFFNIIGASKENYIPMWSCDFQDGLCQWIQVHDDEFDWDVDDGRYDGKYDHTRNSSSGKYIAISSTSGPAVGDKAALVSPTLRPSSGSCQLIFYHRKEYLSSTGNLELFMITRNNKTSIFKSSVIYSSWKKEQISLKSSVEFQIEIVGTVGNSNYKDIAVDDVFFTSDCKTTEKTSVEVVKLSSSSVYNFPEGFLFENKNGSWSRICTSSQAKSACMELGFKDVLTESSSTSGYYSGQSICQPGNVTAPTTPGCSMPSSCITGVYWKCKQDYINVCPELTHKSCTSTGNDLKCLSENQFCDYVNDCPAGEDESNCLNFERCDFETGMCDWLPSKKTQFEWRRSKEYVSSMGRELHVMEADTDHASTMFATARLKLMHAIQGQSNSTCFIRFFYYLESPRSSHLQLQIEDKSTGKKISNVSLSASVLNSWRRRVVLLPQNSLYHVYFNAIYNGRSSVYGVNNISFSSGCKFFRYKPGPHNVSSTTFQCRSGEIIEKKFLCDFKSDCFDGSDELNCTSYKGRCDFETSFCYWKTSGTIMRRNDGRTPSGGTGPSKDHTDKFESGHYVYLEASLVASGTQGYLISKPMMKPRSRRCTFRWFYHMYDNAWEHYHNMGKLEVIYYNPEDKSKRVLWTKKYNQGNSWKYGTVTFIVDSLFFQIMMRATRGMSFKSDIAIDDTSFTSDCFDAPNYRDVQVTQKCTINDLLYVTTPIGGTIFSPNFPMDYTSSLNCDWRIEATPGLRINLQVEYFRTETIVDYLQINGGRRFNGVLSPFYLILNTSKIDLRFHTDSSNTDSGFLLKFFLTDAPAKSITNLNASNVTKIDATVVTDCRRGRSSRYYGNGWGKISSPRTSYSRNYRARTNCVYKFRVPEGFRILVNFTSFKTEPRHDFVQVLYNATIGNSRFSGTLRPFYFVTKSNTLSLRFLTDGSVNAKGFDLTFHTTMHPTSGVKYYSITTTATYRTPVSPTSRTHPLSRFIIQSCSSFSTYTANGTSTYGTITSPNYPGKYSSDTNCKWHTRSTNEQITFIIQFEEVNTESIIDVITVYDESNGNSGTLKTLSGSLSFPSLIPTTGNGFSVSFTSDASVESSGFYLRYSTYPGCFSSSLLSSYSHISSGDGSVVKCLESCNSIAYTLVAVSHDNLCYCSNTDPGAYRVRIEDPSKCKSCDYPHTSYKCGSLSTASVYYSSDAVQPTKQHKVQDSSNAVIASMTSLGLVALFLVIFCYYKKKKNAARDSAVQRQTYRGIETNSATSREGSLCNAPAISNPEQVNNAVYYAPHAPTQFSHFTDVPPSYNEAVEGRVFFVDQPRSQTPVNILEPPPSFSEAMASQNLRQPPMYETIENTITSPQPMQVEERGAGTMLPERNPSPIPPKPDNNQADPVPPSHDSNRSPPSLDGANSQRQPAANVTGNGVVRNIRNLPPIN